MRKLNSRCNPNGSPDPCLLPAHSVERAWFRLGNSDIARQQLVSGIHANSNSALAYRARAGAGGGITRSCRVGPRLTSNAAIGAKSGAPAGLVASIEYALC